MELNQINEAIKPGQQEKMFQESTLQSLRTRPPHHHNLEDTVGNQTTGRQERAAHPVNQAIQEGSRTWRD